MPPPTFVPQIARQFSQKRRTVKAAVCPVRMATPNARKTVVANRLRDVFLDPKSGSARYETVFLDQFGVVHDGQTPYPSAVQCIGTLATEYGVRIVVLSNSSRRATHAIEKLRDSFGVHPDWIFGVVTSGEVAHCLLEGRGKRAKDMLGLELGARVLHTNWSERGRIQLNEAFEPVGTDTDRTDFVLTHGVEGVSVREADADAVLRMAFPEMLALMRNAAKNDRPLLCANPDMVTVDGGQLRDMPGKLAAEYERHGGPVYRLGKPEAIAYQFACQMLTESTGEVIDRSSILAIGDSMQHDIAGACAFGIDSCYIAGGINAEAFGLKADPSIPSTEWGIPDVSVAETVAEIARIETTSSCSPTYSIPFFRWD
ncbi:hypothetical protein FVE85_1977 [Porphyridium purpureum]|uniref:Haloacid dehalogenase-like hydrolase domain-containing protein 2 n=1 Tax=Porphyridium purpureum TaxID=35688 RepID=A0A5J4YY65_PORPP|nr:hypothetical protein FVE85_1977 [Porphyridium purpureum]|eukprot:POR5229..scf209_3